jgi:hypothetical protein
MTIDVGVKNSILESWGENGVAVIVASAKENKAMTFDEFLKSCTACGGNWGGLLLSGIKELFPETYAAIPEHMASSGEKAFALLIDTLILCGIQFEED